MLQYVIISSAYVSLTLPINSYTLYINIVIQHVIYARQNSHACIWLSDNQQNMPPFVIMPGYTTHYKLWCDMSAQHSIDI